jgi:competence protein ComEC
MAAMSLPHESPPRAARRHYRPLVAVVAALAAGIVLDRYFSVNLRFAWGAAIALWIEWALFLRAGRHRSAAAALLVAVALVGATWHHLRWNYFDSSEIGRFARLSPHPACVEVIARAAPRMIPPPPVDPLRLAPSNERTRLDVDLAAIRGQATWRACAGRSTMIVEGRLEGIRAGNRLLVFGRLSKLRPLHNPGEFDFAGYARGNRILTRLAVERPEAVAIVGQEAGYAFDRALDHVRASGHEILRRHLNPAQSELASAVLLGAREHIDDDRLDAYIETGTVHVLSISGLHVGILAAFLFLFLRLGLLPRRAALWLVAATIAAYALLTYAEPPIVRAAILVVIICLGRLWGRRTSIFNSLALAAIVVLAMNPADLFRTGAQLSFLAIATFGAFGLQSIFSSVEDPLDRLIRQSRPVSLRYLHRTRQWLIDLVIVSVMIWLVSMPLVMARFHMFNPIAIALNVVMWVPTVAAMWFGFLLLVFGWLPPLAGAFASVCNVSLWALDGAVHAARDWGYGYWWVAGPDDWWIAGFYAMLAVFLLVQCRMAARWQVVLLIAWVTVGFGAAWHRSIPRDSLTCTFLSVGHGCAVVIELPDGRTMLYDAGHFGSPENGAQTIANYLWSRGITRLDAIVISHNDADHYNAVPELLARVPARVVYVSPTMYRRPSRATNALQEFFVRERVDVREIASDQRFVTPVNQGAVTIDVLHPPHSGVRGNDNANSIVLELTYQGKRVLLTGDLEGDGLARVIELPPRDVDALLAPHHGSPKSSPEEMAPWCTPQYVIVSGGFRDDLYPVQTTYRRFGAEVLHTASVGAVQVEIANGGVSVTSFAPK